jgi:hypothetical protein
MFFTSGGTIDEGFCANILITNCANAVHRFDRGGRDQMGQTFGPGSGTGDKCGLFPTGFRTLGEFGAEFILFSCTDNQKQ